MKPTTEDILEATAFVYGMPVEEVTKKSRLTEYVRPRQIAQYLCKRMDTDILRIIAKKTGITNHATVLSSYALIAHDVTIDSTIATYVTKVERRLQKQGFRVSEVEKITGFIDLYNPYDYNRREIIPVRIVNKETGERILANSISAAERITGVNRAAITRECRKISNTKYNFKFSFDE